MCSSLTLTLTTVVVFVLWAICVVAEVYLGIVAVVLKAQSMPEVHMLSVLIVNGTKGT